MVCSRVEGSTGSKGRIKVRRLERVVALSDSWTDGRDEVAFAVLERRELEADRISSRSTGEILVR